MFRHPCLLLLTVMIVIGGVHSKALAQEESKPKRGLFNRLFGGKTDKPQTPAPAPTPAAPAPKSSAATTSSGKAKAGEEAKKGASGGPSGGTEKKKGESESTAKSTASQPAQTRNSDAKAQTEASAAPASASGGSTAVMSSEPARPPATAPAPSTPLPASAAKDNAATSPAVVAPASSPAPTESAPALAAPAPAMLIPAAIPSAPAPPPAPPAPQTQPAPPAPAPAPATAAGDGAKPPATGGSPEAEAKPVDKGKRDSLLNQVRGAIRTAARQADAVRKRQGLPQADVEGAVEKILTRDAPQQPQSVSPRSQQALAHLRRPEPAFELNCLLHTGGRGFDFDHSVDGRQIQVEQLRRQQAEGTREVERLLQLGRVEALQGRPEMAQAMHQRAVLAARKLADAAPGDGAAKALLAEALAANGGEMRLEMLRVLVAALETNPPPVRALLVRLEDHAARLRENLLREGPRTLDQPARDPLEVLQRLHLRAPTDAAVTAHALAAADLRGIANQILERGGDGRPEFLLRACAALMEPEMDAQITALARSGAAGSPAAFELKVARIANSGAGGRLPANANWLRQLQRVLDAAGDDGQMIATVSAMPLLWAAADADPDMAREKVWSTLPEPVCKLFETGMDRAARIGQKSDTVNAAKACEAVACFEFVAATLGGRVRNEGLALRAITLDPGRIRALDLLSAQFAAGFPAASQALMEIRAAVFEGYSSNRLAAAAAGLARDYASAQRHLEACLRLRKDDLPALNHLIAVRLLGDQDGDRLNEIEKRFETARAAYNDQQDSLPPEEIEGFVVNYFVYLCLREDYESAAEALALAAGNRQVRMQTIEELGTLLEK